MSIGEVIKVATDVAKSGKAPDTVDDLREIWELHCLGSSVKDIAKAYGVPLAVVRGWIDQYRSLFASELSRTQRSMLLTDSLAFFRTTRDIAMSEMQRVQTSTKIVTEDGEVTDADSSPNPQLLSARARLLKTAIDAEKQAADLLIKTGVLPSAAKDINISIMDANNANAAQELADDEAARSTEEILDSISGYLTRTVQLVDDIPDDEPIDAEVIEKTDA